MNRLREIRFFQEGQSPKEGENKRKMETPRWIDEREVSEIIAVAVQTLRNWRFQSTGPAYFKIGRSVRYRLSDIIAFMELRRVHPVE